MNSGAEFRIAPQHRQRHAIIYVRQSSARQVRDHRESTQVQRSLREKAIALGWRAPIIIDEDLGVTASGFADRAGFNDLLARVTRHEVGIILAVDVSRLSRNSRDWAHLLELCGFFGTLIADLDQIYDLAEPNDRLVLGIKGSVSELELNIIKHRMRSGVEAKAARGELHVNLPTGYAYDSDDRIAFDPDQRVQAALRAMFDDFDRATSVRQLVLGYRDLGTLFPVRVGYSGVRWEQPTQATLQKLLQHPIYAGAYVFGRRQTHVEYDAGKLVKRKTGCVAPEQARVFIRDHHPAYISWKRFEANVAKIANNRPRWSMQENQTAIREGAALLPGLLRCRQCGARLHVGYKAQHALYYCDGGAGKGSKRCLSFGSAAIDHAVGLALLEAVFPLAVQASARARELSCEMRDQQLEQVRLQVAAAEYEADRAFEQFDQVDPRNRLVADTLEQRLNEKLLLLQRAREKCAEIADRIVAVSEGDRQRLAGLGSRFEAVWSHAEADPILKKRLLRTAIQEILVSVEADPPRVVAVIHWTGGCHTELFVAKRGTRAGGESTEDLVTLVTGLAASLNDGQIARILNMQKKRSAQGLVWTLERVLNFRHVHQIRTGHRDPRPPTLTMSAACGYLAVSRNAMLGLVKLGLVHPNQVTAFAPWRVPQEQLDSEAVRHAVATLKRTGWLPKAGCPKSSESLFDV